MDRPLSVVLSLLLLTLAACSSDKAASPTPRPKPAGVVVAESESDFQEESDWNNETRAEVRQTVSDTIKAKLPAWVLKGISTEPYHNNVYWVAVDIEKNGRSVVLNLVARKFFSESGSPYWKVVLADTTLKAQLHSMNDADTWNKLNEAKEEIENLRNPPVEDDRGDYDPQ